MNYNKIKKDAKQNLKHNYFKNVIIVFICTFLISGGISISSKNILNIDFFKQENIEILNNKNKSNSEIIDELLEKTLEEKEYEEKIASTYTHGILAILINEITATKSVLFSLLDSVNKLLGGNFSVAMIILLGNFIAFIFRVFIFAVLEVGRNRYFLEQRRYLTTNVDRFLYPYKKKKTLKLSLIILIRNIKLLLWGFTIVGWFIKYYEYIMIPYVLAENPNIKAKDAFKLSKELTNGEKFNIFKLDLMFINKLYIVKSI